MVILKNGLREKKEILYYNNGKFVDGEWKYDLREGYITFYSFILVKKNENKLKES